MDEEYKHRKLAFEMTDERMQDITGNALGHYVSEFILSAITLGMETLAEEVIEKCKPAAMRLGSKAATSYNQRLSVSTELVSVVSEEAYERMVQKLHAYITDPYDLPNRAKY